MPVRRLLNETGGGARVRAGDDEGLTRQANGTRRAQIRGFHAALAGATQTATTSPRWRVHQGAPLSGDTLQRPARLVGPSVEPKPLSAGGTRRDPSHASRRVEQPRATVQCRAALASDGSSETRSHRMTAFILSNRLRQREREPARNRPDAARVGSSGRHQAPPNPPWQDTPEVAVRSGPPRAARFRSTQGCHLDFIGLG